MTKKARISLVILSSVAGLLALGGAAGHVSQAWAFADAPGRVASALFWGSLALAWADLLVNDLAPPQLTLERARRYRWAWYLGLSTSLMYVGTLGLHAFAEGPWPWWAATTSFVYQVLGLACFGVSCSVLRHRWVRAQWAEHGTFFLTTNDTLQARPSVGPGT